MTRKLSGLLLALFAVGCGGELYSESYVARANAWLGNFTERPPLRTVRGEVTYYHDSLAGNYTANGEVYDPRMLTAASRTLRFGTVVRLVRVDNGRRVIVRVNDRGPYGRKRRLLDLSRAAARELGILQRGAARVRAEILWVPGKPERTRAP